MIRPVIDHYGQFQNGRCKIHGFSRNVLLNMVFLNFASQARFECLIFYRSLKYLQMMDVIFKTQSKMAARNDQEMFKISHFLANIFEAHVSSCKQTPTIGVIWFRDNP